MALDVGDKTIGVAISDPLGITVEPLTVIKRSEGVRADLRAVEALARERDVSKIVVGIPIMLTGEEAVQAGKVRQFVQRLAGRLDIPVVTWDERLTTVEAERMLIEADQTRAARKRVVDKVAAAIILRSYLAANG
jgi:putative Holliday junction resolvase